MLEWEGSKECPATLVRIIPKEQSAFGPALCGLCPALGPFFANHQFDGSAIADSIRKTLPRELERAEKHVGYTLTTSNLEEFFLSIDEALSPLYLLDSKDQCDDSLHSDLIRLSSFILARNFGNHLSLRDAYRHLLWEPVV